MYSYFGDTTLNSSAMSWKVLITARTMNEVGLSALQLLREANCELLIPPKPGPFSTDELLKLLPDVEGVLARSDPAATPAQELLLLRAGVVGQQLPALQSASVQQYFAHFVPPSATHVVPGAHQGPES